MLNVFWTNYARKALNNIIVFYKDKEGSRMAGRLFTGLARETKNLSGQRYLDQQEGLLANCPERFRHLGHKRYKIVY